MLGSIHLVDGGARSTAKALRRPPTPGSTPGLRIARSVVAVPVGGVPAPQVGRFGLVAFWEDEASLDTFLDTHPFAEALADGWSVRLEPLRAVPVASGHYPGVPDDLTTSPGPGADGPAVVLTIGQLRLARTIPFLRASRRAEKQVHEAPGLLWVTGLLNPAQRLVSTFSLWERGEQSHAYATSTTGHSAAMGEQEAKSFHHAGSFIRFRPYAASGSLPGDRNPLSQDIAGRLNGSG